MVTKKVMFIEIRPNLVQSPNVSDYTALDRGNNVVMAPNDLLPDMWKDMARINFNNSLIYYHTISIKQPSVRSLKKSY